MPLNEYFVVKYSELSPPPSLREVEVGSTKLLLVHAKSGLYVVDALCPHAKAPLVEGALCGTRLVCPWHQSVFEITDGSLLEPPSLDGLTRYPVRLDEDDVLVTLHERMDAPASQMPRRTSDELIAVVGAGAAGQAAVEELRKVGYGGRIILIGSEPQVPYDRTNLSKHFLTGQAQAKQLPLRDPESFLKGLNVERRVATVTSLDTARKTLRLQSGELLKYDAVLLATGGVPSPLNVPGGDLPGVCLLRSVEDASRIISLAELGKRAVVIGGSFIGLEAASSLAQRGVKVEVVLKGKIPLEGQLGREVGGSIQKLHEHHGVTFRTNVTVVEISRADDGLNLALSSGERIVADFVVVGLGIRPATDFVEGVDLRPDGGVVVDEYLHAGNDCYAAGDIAAFPLFPGDKPDGRVRVEHWRVAQQHARLAAQNMAGTQPRATLASTGFVPFYWTFNFGQRLNHVGHCEKPDKVILDGHPDRPPFLAYYVEKNEMRAVCGVGHDAGLAALHELLRLNRRPSVEELRGGNYSPLVEVARDP